VIVVDASAALEMLLRTPAGLTVEQRLFHGGETLYAPHLIDLEIAQVLRRYAITGAVDSERCRMALLDWADVPLRRFPHDFLLSRVWELRDNMTAYDAVYVALAEVLDAPLLTRDQRLASAPRHHARIELV
jgi:predicted nucleic acid-binding protein